MIGRMTDLMSRRGVLAGGLVALAGCDVSDIPRNPRRITAVFEQDVSQLDPAMTLAIAELAVARLAYQRLLRPVIRDGRVAGLTGDLAESWQWAPDRSAVTFRLRPGARFDDGTPVTGEAVRFTMERVTRQKMPAAQAMFWLGGIELPNPLTVVMKVAVFMPFIEHMLWHPGLSIINPAVERFAVDGDQGSAWLRENSAGSGPYRIARFSPRSDVVMRTNPHASRKPRYFDEVVIRTVRDMSARSMQIASGEVDIVEYVRVDQARWLDRQPKVDLVTGQSASILFLHMNNEKPPFNDVRVRQAVNLAINREQLIRSVYGGGAQLLHGIIPLGVPGADPSIPLPVFDLPRARALLAQAGVRQGTPVTLTTVTDSGPSLTSLALREYLVALGFDANIREVSTAARTTVMAGDFQMFAQMLQLDFPDPWIVFNFAFNTETIGASNWSRYRNPALDKMVAVADRTEGDERARRYAEAQRIILRDMPSIPILQDSWTYARRSDIAGGSYNFSTPQSHDFFDMYRT